MNYTNLPQDWKHYHTLQRKAGIRVDKSCVGGYVVEGELIDEGTKLQPNLPYHTSIMKTINFEKAGEAVSEWLFDSISQSKLEGFYPNNQTLIEFLLGIRESVYVIKGDQGKKFHPPIAMRPKTTLEKAVETFKPNF